MLISCTTVSESNEPTREIIDCLGRSVQVPEVVETVGCIYAISGHVTAMLGEGEKIVSVTSGLKRDILLNDLVPSIKDATEPKNGGSINIEELIKDKPDVIFVSVDIALNEAETKKLDKFKIPYLAIQFDSIEGQQFMVDMIAQVYHEEELAREYIDYYNGVVTRLEERTIDIDNKIRAFHSINEATRTDPKDSIAAEWFEKSGFILVSTLDELNFVSNDYYASLEQILEWNPDVIFCNENGVDDYIMTDSKWQALSAVKDERVYMLPVGISRWGHPNSLEIPLAMMFTSKMMYPELFEDLNMKDEMFYFYKTFFDIEMDDEMMTSILEGDGMRIRKDEK